MKKAMSNVDVAAVVEELRKKLVGSFVGKAYQQSSDKIVISLQTAGQGKKDLLFEAGRRVHITQKPRKAPKMPPQFPTILRQRISGGRIAEINQHDFDRVVEIVIERGENRYLLIVELFPKGNVLLLDESGQIVLPLRPYAFRDRRLLAGEEYQYHGARQTDPRIVSRREIADILAHSDVDLVRTLVRGLNMGGIYGEEVCLRAGVEKSQLANSLTQEEINRVHAALKEVFNPEFVESLEPVLIYEDGKPLDVVPTPLQIYEGLERKKFPSFSMALDDYFFSEDIAPKPKTALERRKEMQERSIEEFRRKEKDFSRNGELIYERYGEIEAILKVISDAMDKGFTYSEIWAKIKTSGLPVAKQIVSIDYQGEVKLQLDKDGPVLDLNAKLTLPQNAERYYDKSKEMTKKIDGAKKALEITTKLIEKKEAPKPKTRRVVKRRKPRWYERFRWFYSSDGFLVIGGRDANSNEEIYSKYLEKRDFALHTDAPGAPLTVIKTEGKEVPESTLEEAAQFAVSYSSVWKAGLFEGDCYLINGDQVTKTPESGEFLRKGAFVIRGERRYFRDVPVDLSIGLADEMLIGGPSSAIRGKAKPVVEIEPGEFNPDDLAKRIYRIFTENVDDRRFLKSVASTEQIVSFLPPGRSGVKR